MEPQTECMPVLIGATPEGKKELVGFQVGVRESAQSWRELLAGLKARGLAIAPQLATLHFAHKNFTSGGLWRRQTAKTRSDRLQLDNPRL